MDALTPACKRKPAPQAQAPRRPPFWKRKTLREMTPRGVGEPVRRLRPLLPQQARGGGHRRLYYTDVGCRLLDGETCRCTDYTNRTAKVDDCVALSTRNINRINWLPPTCGYKLVAAGKDLYWWHPLVSGDPETVHAAGISVRGKMSATEGTVPDDKLDEHIVSWPMKWPKGSRG